MWWSLPTRHAAARQDGRAGDGQSGGLSARSAATPLLACLVLPSARPDRTTPHHTTWSRPDALPSAGVHLTQIRDANSEIVRPCKSQALWISDQLASSCPCRARVVDLAGLRGVHTQQNRIACCAVYVAGLGIHRRRGWGWGWAATADATVQVVPQRWLRMRAMLPSPRCYWIRETNL